MRTRLCRSVTWLHGLLSATGGSVVVDTLVAEVVVAKIAPIGIDDALFVAKAAVELFRPKFAGCITRVDTDCAVIFAVAVGNAFALLGCVAVVWFAFGACNGTAVAVVVAVLTVAALDVACVDVDGDVVEVLVATVDVNDSVVLGTDDVC